MVATSSVLFGVFGFMVGAGTVCARRRALIAATVLLAVGGACFVAALANFHQAQHHADLRLTMIGH
jgi:hypothetical protein